MHKSFHQGSNLGFIRSYIFASTTVIFLGPFGTLALINFYNALSKPLSSSSAEYPYAGGVFDPSVETLPYSTNS